MAIAPLAPYLCLPPSNDPVALLENARALGAAYGAEFTQLAAPRTGWMWHQDEHEARRVVLLAAFALATQDPAAPPDAIGEWISAFIKAIPTHTGPFGIRTLMGRDDSVTQLPERARQGIEAAGWEPRGGPAQSPSASIDELGLEDPDLTIVLRPSSNAAAVGRARAIAAGRCASGLSTTIATQQPDHLWPFREIPTVIVEATGSSPELVLLEARAWGFPTTADAASPPSANPTDVSRYLGTRYATGGLAEPNVGELALRRRLVQGLQELPKLRPEFKTTWVSSYLASAGINAAPLPAVVTARLEWPVAQALHAFPGMQPDPGTTAMFELIAAGEAGRREANRNTHPLAKVRRWVELTIANSPDTIELLLNTSHAWDFELQLLKELVVAPDGPAARRVRAGIAIIEAADTSDVTNDRAAWDAAQVGMLAGDVGFLTQLARRNPEMAAQFPGVALANMTPRPVVPDGETMMWAQHGASDGELVYATAHDPAAVLRPTASASFPRRVLLRPNTGQLMYPAADDADAVVTLHGSSAAAAEAGTVTLAQQLADRRLGSPGTRRNYHIIVDIGQFRSLASVRALVDYPMVTLATAAGQGEWLAAHPVAAGLMISLISADPTPQPPDPPSRQRPKTPPR